MENNKKITKDLPASEILEQMQALNFELIHQFKDSYLFLNEKVGLCEIDIYKDRIDAIKLIINYASKKLNDGFSDSFSSASWSSSIGHSSGYGYNYKIGSLKVDCLEDAIEDISKKGRFVMPFANNPYLFAYDQLSDSEKDKYHRDKNTDTLVATPWAFDNLIDKKHQRFLGNYKKDPEKENVLAYWDDYIRWNNKVVTKKDKPFYSIAKEIILTDDSIDKLLSKEFLYHTTDLGHNFCHLMSLVQNPSKKQALWNQLESLEHKSAYMNQNDLNGYNPLLMMIQNTYIKLTQDKDQHLDYINRYLGVPQIEKSLCNEKNSFFDCLSYLKGLDKSCSLSIAQLMLNNSIEIPKIFLKKERIFTSAQKVIEKISGNNIYPYIGENFTRLMQAYELSEKMHAEMPEKEKTKLKKI